MQPFHLLYVPGEPLTKCGITLPPDSQFFDSAADVPAPYTYCTDCLNMDEYDFEFKALVPKEESTT